MKILVFGLPESGKTTLAEKLQKELQYNWFNADEVRKHHNDWDFSEEGRIRQAYRMRDLCEYKDSIADFVAPTNEIRNIFNADFTIWMNTIKNSRYKDTNKIFEEPQNADIIINDFNYNIVEIIKEIKCKYK